ncbi:bifunctional diaminohydroxyphosphoribosylaminopyrimidine deaminase/5-amino-6-(5-phosphoribosylamino)uracil reductase [Pararhizobium antarcticum]|uniref:Riboflavin biosynthesis protein RibD n=2 Tax=Pararhizobium antarcticum TaxID=1798805 RepID=A0A657M1X9_9HYPH|nr:bifunctional diaminohydroxyphosphoribosylaminopyrimidine deaminase/5-amino-6-(5-phosphoribosylamino)uracil reductase [Rhizobium sp. 58]OJG00770.1 bifunctional diaminohydroxyphosphoribosylaminopyrimidine deaminase/5-amino-6-(5-phosphoribosylamino)uracil reductase [Pararhizobium antarcticum]
MDEAVRLSAQHLGQTATNPSVGCIIVRDDGDGPVIVGRAVTALGGRPHAETQALKMAGEKARGATAYVTLEPCSHHGRTPPCTEALIASGIGRVVISVLDPDERVSGRGAALLREAGIKVTLGTRSQQSERALEAYLMRQRSKRPHVTLKLAISADGMIGRKGEGQVRITGAEAREAVHHLRARIDAILVGIGTAIADDPELTSRLPGLEERSPVRIVLDRRLDLPLSSKLARTARDVRVIAVADSEIARATVDDAFDARRTALEALGVEVLDCNSAKLADLLMALATRGVSSLLVEGGARTAVAFLDAGLVDRILLFRGPGRIGETGIASPFDTRSIPSGFRLVETRGFGADICDTYERDI